MNSYHQESKLQSKAAVMLITFSIIIFIITLLAGIISDSIALLLDASTGFIVVFMAFMLSLGIKKVNLPPDRFFNYGYEKFEPFTAVIQGTMIMFSCLIASYFAIQDIIHAEDIARYDIPTVVSFTTGVIAISVAFYLKRVSHKTHSAILKVSSLHWFIDGLFSFSLALGFLFGLYVHKIGLTHITPYVDPVMALILAVIFMWTPVKLIKLNISQLLDAAPIEEVRNNIEEIVEKHKAKAFGIHSIRARRAGEKVFLDVCFEIHGHTTMIDAQRFTESFEKDIAAKFPKYDVIVYFYPALNAEAEK
jgi:cation diffusion facilitator family transporter